MCGSNQFISMADGIFPDIADRLALVIDTDHKVCERIPPIDPDHAKITLTSKVSFVGPATLAISGDMVFSGENALDWTGADLRAAPPKDSGSLSFFFGWGKRKEI